MPRMLIHKKGNKLIGKLNSHFNAEDITTIQYGVSGDLTPDDSGG
jgi:hypothetical protein